MNCQGSYCYWLWTWHCDPWRQSLLLCHFIDLDTRRFNQQMHSLCTLNRTKKSNKQSLHSFLPGTVCGLPTWPLQLLSQIHWWDLPLIWKLFHVIHPNSFIYDKDHNNYDLYFLIIRIYFYAFPSSHQIVNISQMENIGFLTISDTLNSLVFSCIWELFHLYKKGYYCEIKQRYNNLLILGIIKN